MTLLLMILAPKSEFGILKYEDESRADNVDDSGKKEEIISD